MTDLGQRFWSKVDQTGNCWEWHGGKDSCGYGRFRVGETKKGAHRLSYEEAFGTIPDGMCVDHICHNPGCVNPGHLRLATHKQNMENKLGAYSNSKSGVRGVSWNAWSKKWAATVKHNGKVRHLGYFATVPEAEAVVLEARLELFTHNDADRRVTA
ncbi:MAG TPA: HNH endonuclease [Arthrobacter bacterium]|nr:HNH endonuclease [Arthrobacter sp.]